MPARPLVAVAFAAMLAAVCQSADAACMNKYVSRSEGTARQVVTLLTGKLTFDEAKTLAAAINSKQSPPMEWVDATGKALARQLGDIKVVRPMPVGCDGRASGVVLTITFMSITPPRDTIHIKFDPKTTVDFEQQKE